MRRISKAICVALSLMLLVNLTGFEVMASGVDSGQEGTAETGGGTKADGAPEGTDEPDKDTVPGDTPVITDDGIKNQDDNTDEAGKTDGNGADADITDDTNTPEDGADNPEDGAGNQPEDAAEPEQAEPEEALIEPQNDTEVQEISGLAVKPVAGRTDQMEVSWIVVQGVTYKVEVKDPSNKIDTYDAPSEGKQVITVVAGKKYDITLEASASGGGGEDAPQTKTVPAVLLLTPVVKSTASETSVKLTWNAIEGADSYEVAYSGKTETVKGTSLTVNNPADGEKFTVKAVAVLKDDSGNEYRYESDAGQLALDKKPAKVSGLTGIDGDKSAILTWSKAAGAESYIIYRYNSSKKKWEAVKKDVKKLTYTDKKLSAGKKYKYRVAAANDGGVGKQSATITVSVKKTPGTTVRSIGYKATIKSRAPLFTSKSSKKRVRYLAKGTRVTTIDYGNGRYQIKLSDGKKYWVSKIRLTFRASIWTNKDYSTKVKEDFVNKKGYKSPTKYLIWISQYTQRVIIYQGSKGKWKMIRSCRCATGTHLHMTPKGVHKITYKEKGWFYRTTYEKPIVHFKSQNAFHSRIKNYKGGYADATIGRPRSKGCVRLYDEDINFIYKKCPKGTTVVSY